MAIDHLQDKIRKLKVPIVLEIGTTKQLPEHLLEQEGSLLGALGRFCRELLETMAGKVPAVRFRLARFALMGTEGLTLLTQLLAEAKAKGYYVMLDLPEALTPWDAEDAAAAMHSGLWPCDGVVVSGFAGSDCWKPYVQAMQENDLDLFAVVRTGNKSAAELQDLLTGGRLVHLAAADIVNRLGQGMYGRCGYSRVAALAGPGATDALRVLRERYPKLFLLVEHYDYSNLSLKKCAQAFDRFGHGAAICVGRRISDAWIEAETDGYDYLQQASLALERMKKNLAGIMPVL